MQVRVMLTGESKNLRDKAFGTGRIVVRREEQAIVVPLGAVQATSDGNLIFVRDRGYFDPNGFKVFHVRQVRLGAKSDTHVELLAGALPGEVVATKGSNVLLAQLLRSSLGAGCGCHQE
jgi:cobalt-zinc-cadmium efflux system membrane fusion protein